MGARENNLDGGKDEDCRADGGTLSLVYQLSDDQAVIMYLFVEILRSESQEGQEPSP